MSPESRGRIVMLVDNGVNGDSRVQKTARSAAEAGWEVILVGRSPEKKARSWQLGEAKVRLIPMPTPLLKPRHQFRRAPLRRPLAYPAGRLAAHRRQQVLAWQSDLRVRRAATNSRLLLSRAAVKVFGRWVALRVRQTAALTDTRRSLDSRFDRFTTAFWRSTMGDRSWRRLDPHLWDFELAYGPVVDKLRPDLIHANDFRMLGVGARAKLRALARGHDVKLVWDAHEFLPGIKPWNTDPRWHPAQCAHEREYSRHADAVITVSDTLADLLVEGHGLSEPPALVLNAPDGACAPGPDLRELCGVGPEVPLAVYSGAAAPQRGLDVMVEALPHIRDLHVALVVLRPASPYVAGLRARARELGVQQRLHVLPYVPHEQVVSFLSSADAGIIPIHHWPNHEIALITKFFEYSHARLPLVVSDVRTMAAMTRSTGQGEVFEAEDTADFVRALRAVLADPSRYRAAYDVPGLLERWTWEAQAEVLDQVYGRLVPQVRSGRRPVRVTT